MPKVKERMLEDKPLVSVIITCYNSADTLYLALVSLIGQTYTNWEGIVIDDGSADNPRAIVEKCNDNRFKFIRLEKNRGRGSAYQKGMVHARGKYIAILDSDDWLYSNKLEKQVATMEKYPDLVLVSCQIAVVDAKNTLRGIHRRYADKLDEILTYDQLNPPLFPYPASMMRAAIAKEYRYESGFRISQDRAFLIEVLLNRKYLILSDVMYAYNEYSSFNILKTIKGHWNGFLVYLRYIRSYPLSVVKYALITVFKMFIYTLFSPVFNKSFILNLRNKIANPHEKMNFKAEKKRLEELCLKHD